MVADATTSRRTDSGHRTPMPEVSNVRCGMRLAGAGQLDATRTMCDPTQCAKDKNGRYFHAIAELAVHRLPLPREAKAAI